MPPFPASVPARLPYAIVAGDHRAFTTAAADIPSAQERIPLAHRGEVEVGAEAASGLFDVMGAAKADGEQAETAGADREGIDFAQDRTLVILSRPIKQLGCAPSSATAVAPRLCEESADEGEKERYRKAMEGL